jgi:NADPH:quinone reductase-like Zn-dependent oxidoreductase
VAFPQASTLPIAGMAGLRALELGGFLLGKRVLVTGARGAVGRLATQLAHAAGAHVTACVRPRTRAPGSLPTAPAKVAGAYVVTEHVLGRFDLIIETVGGEILGEAIESLEPRGLLVAVATPDLDGKVTFRTWRTDRSAGARIHILDHFDEFRGPASIHTDLKLLLELVATFKLDVGVEVEEAWQNTPQVIQAFLDRRIAGRAVLRVR